MGVTFHDHSAGGGALASPIGIRRKKKVILGSPRSIGFDIQRPLQGLTLGEIRVVVAHQSDHLPVVAALKRLHHSWLFRWGLCCQQLRRRMRQRTAVLVILCCAAALGWSLGLLP